VSKLGNHGTGLGLHATGAAGLGACVECRPGGWDPSAESGETVVSNCIDSGHLLH
jgi:hypothetical protein